MIALNRKIIHVMFDEKFTDMAIRQFESAMPGVHEYWVTSQKLVLTKSPLARKCQQNELMKKFSRPDIAGVVFHCLPSFRYSLLRNIPDDKCVVWLGWGYDYYSLLKNENESSRILPKTRVLAKSLIFNQIKNKVKLVIKKLVNLDNSSVRGLQRVDYFSPVLDLEFEMVQRHVKLRASYIGWNYGTAEEDLSLPNAGFSSGTNILAGNSASATNNHVELFEAIGKQVDVSDRKIIVPLSYGDSHYRDKVISVGEKMFGEAFMPLTEFMPINQYLETIRSCGFVMMNHLRQQALGNICMAMLMGAKVYLNDGNPLSKWLGQRGAVFGSMDMLDMASLTEHERDINYRLIHSHWGRDVQIQKTRSLIDVIFATRESHA